MKRTVYVILVLLLFFGCKESYTPPVASPVTGYLVVDGFINCISGITTITLTRTTKLVDSAKIVYEYNAQVNIEDENNGVYPLYESGEGTYVSDNLSLSANQKYRIHIRTSDNKEYVSDFTKAEETPAIDSISWQLENGGVQIYVNTSDASNNYKYYQWKYSETWEFHSPYVKMLSYAYDPVTNRPIDVVTVPDTSIYKCWKTQRSTNMILGSTEKLTDNKVYLPFRYIEPGSYELSVLYYIELKQYALSKEAYFFKQKLKKNTEQLGTIFDAQPSELGGNIHSVSDPTETVIGFVDVTHEEVGNLFIDHAQLQNWPTQIPCNERKFTNTPDDLDGSLMPTRVNEYGPFNRVLTFFASDPICVDCTLRGTNIKPSFWPR